MSHGGGNEASAEQIVWFKKHFCHILLCVSCDVSSKWMRRRWRYFNAAATPASSRYRHGLPARLDGDVCVQPNDPSHGRSCASYLDNKLGKPASQLDTCKQFDLFRNHLRNAGHSANSDVHDPSNGLKESHRHPVIYCQHKETGLSTIAGSSRAGPGGLG